MNMANVAVWCDIPATDLDRAVGFYDKVLGEASTIVEENGVRFAVLPHADGVGGCIVLCDDMVPSRTGLLVYLNVQGRHEAAEAAVAACGGEVLQTKHAIGPHGYRSVVVDSEGNRIALHSR
jgi:predicted enzyme related to lactoylglutathione lyase